VAAGTHRLMLLPKVMTHPGAMVAPTHLGAVVAVDVGLGADRSHDLPMAATPTILIVLHLMISLEDSRGHVARSASNPITLLTYAGAGSMKNMILTIISLLRPHLQPMLMPIGTWIPP
jgi:hypothetical protein